MSTNLLSQNTTIQEYLQEAAWMSAWQETISCIIEILTANWTDTQQLSFFNKQLDELHTGESLDESKQDQKNIILDNILDNILNNISTTTQAYTNLKDTTVEELKNAFQIIALSQKVTDQISHEREKLVACLCCYQQKLDYADGWFDTVYKIGTAYAWVSWVYQLLRSLITAELDWLPTYTITSNQFVQHSIHKNTNEIAISFRDLEQFPLLRKQIIAWKDMSKVDQYITFVSPRFLELMKEHWCSFSTYDPTYHQIWTWEQSDSLPEWEKIWTELWTRQIQRTAQK